MKKALVMGPILFAGLCISLAVAAPGAAAQGPAGAGAASAAQDSSHAAESLNPIKFFKKDSRNSGAPLDRGGFEAKLTPKLQTEGLLGAYPSATEACAPYTDLYDCLAGLHASHSVGVDFNCIRAAVTGVHTVADVSNCKVADGEKALRLTKAIRQLKPDANAKKAAKDAEQQAREDLNSVTQ